MFTSLHLEYILYNRKFLFFKYKNWYSYIVVDLQQKLYNNSELEIVHIIWLEGE